MGKEEKAMLLALENKMINVLACIKNKFDNMLVECNAWYVVLLAVLLCLAFTIVSGLVIWCVVYKGKSFTGDWKWELSGVSVKAECK